MNTRASLPDAWFEKADHDLAAIDTLLNSSAILWDVVAFHAQQAAEKYLKGFLVANGAVVPKIHDLVVLLGQCARHDPSLEPLKIDCEGLTRLGWISRYPDAPADPDEDETRVGVEIARRIRAEILQRVPSSEPE